jgi:hypothetical protein
MALVQGDARHVLAPALPRTHAVGAARVIVGKIVLIVTGVTLRLLLVSAIPGGEVAHAACETRAAVLADLVLTKIHASALSSLASIHHRLVVLVIARHAIWKARVAASTSLRVATADPVALV